MCDGIKDASNWRFRPVAGDNVSIDSLTTFMQGRHDVHSEDFEWFSRKVHISRGSFIGSCCLIKGE